MQLKQVYGGLNSDNILTKSRKLEKKSSWIVKLRSSLTLKKPMNHAHRFQFLFNIYLGYRSRCTCVLQLAMACAHCLSHKGESGAPNGRRPRFLEPAEPAIATPLLLIFLDH